MFGRVFKVIALAGALATAGSAQARTINLVTDAGWERFAFGAIGTTPSREYSFTLAANAILTVVDGFFAGDVLEVFANTVSLGQTSAPGASGTNHGMNFDAALADSAFSSGSFILGPGSYNVTFAVLQRSPGNGNHLAAIRVDTAPIPVPAAGALLLSGLGIGVFLRRRRRPQA